MKPRISEQDVERVFDRYCKKVLKEKNIDLQREAIRRGEREVTFSALSTRELAELAVMDEYFKDAYIFDVHGESVSVTDCIRQNDGYILRWNFHHDFSTILIFWSLWRKR